MRVFWLLVFPFNFLMVVKSTQLTGQICPGNQGTVDITNEIRIGADEFTFEVMLRNSGSSSNTMTAFLGGIIGLPVGVIGSFTVVEQPSVTGNWPGWTSVAASFDQTQGSGGVPIMRWNNPPVAVPGLLMPTVFTKFAKFRFLRTGGTSLPSTINLTWQPYPSVAHPQITSYCNSNPVAQALSQADGTLLVVGGLLPIDLTNFRARATGATNLIEWVTASERNTAWHVVERSANGTDNWEQIGKLAAAGTSSEQHTYSLEDKQPLAKSYYRLRSIDFDGKEERSSVVLVTRKHGIFGVTGAYPSPTADRVTVQFESLEEMPVTVQVFDFNGRLVMQQDILADKGVNLSALDMTNLQAGTYTLHLVTTDAVSAQVKVVKQ